MLSPHEEPQAGKTVIVSHQPSNLPDEALALLISRVALLPPKAVEIVTAILPYIPRAFETGYGAINITIRNNATTIEITTSIRL
jgi:hypothetical protein